MKQLYTTAIATVCLTFSLSSAAERKMPESTYHCQVTTVSGTSGLITIQADSRQRASEIAGTRPAITYEGNREASSKVVQCIEKFSTESFFDVRFQHFVDDQVE